MLLEENFNKKETLVHVFSCQFFEISKNPFSYRIAPVAASDHLTAASLTSLLPEFLSLLFVISPLTKPLHSFLYA